MATVTESPSIRVGTPKIMSSMSQVTWWSLLSCTLFLNAWPLWGIKLTLLWGCLRRFARLGHLLGMRESCYPSTVAKTGGKTRVLLSKQAQVPPLPRSPNPMWISVLCPALSLSRDSKGHRAHLSRTLLNPVSFPFPSYVPSLSNSGKLHLALERRKLSSGSHPHPGALQSLGFLCFC